MTQSVYNLHTGQTQLQPRHQQNQQQTAGTERRKTSMHTRKKQQQKNRNIKHDNLG